MEVIKGAEALVHDGVAVAKWIGERLVGGAFAALANTVVQPHEVNPANIQVYEGNITKGEN